MTPARIVRVPFLLAWPPRAYAAQVLLPGVIFVRRGVHASPRLIAHELVHVDQLERMGLVRYWVRYLWFLARHGYWDNPLESEARRGESDPAMLARARALLANT